MAKSTNPEEIVRLLMDVSRTLSSHYDAKLAELHLTLPQAMLLRQLGDALPMNEAAGNPFSRGGVPGMAALNPGRCRKKMEG